MSFYEPQGWQAPARQSSWEQPPPPSRSGTQVSDLGREQTVDIRQAQVARRREKMAMPSQSNSKVCPSADLYPDLSDIAQRLTGPLTTWSKVENITSLGTDVTRYQS